MSQKYFLDNKKNHGRFSICWHRHPHGQKCQTEGPRPIPVDFGCSRFIFERLVGFKKFGWAIFEKIDFLKI